MIGRITPIIGIFVFLGIGMYALNLFYCRENIKEKLMFFIPIAVICIVLFGFVIPMEKELDFFEFHVWECEQAHAENYSFAVCSGFWYEPEYWHIEDACIVHPSENPRDNIMHGSNLGSTGMVNGLYGYITTDTMVYP